MLFTSIHTVDFPCVFISPFILETVFHLSFISVIGANTVTKQVKDTEREKERKKEWERKRKRNFVCVLTELHRSEVTCTICSDSIDEWLEITFKSMKCCGRINDYEHLYFLFLLLLLLLLFAWSFYSHFSHRESCKKYFSASLFLLTLQTEIKRVNKWVVESVGS